MSAPVFRKVLILAALGFLMQACSLFSETPPSRDAYIAGEIVNPLAKEIVISQGNKPIDTVAINRDNRFFYSLKNVQPGLYNFSHGQESQIMFLEPGDSTVIYANTINFDESLNFSGRGAEKNNFLIEMYLLNEKNNEFILSCTKTKPEDFASKTDSIKTVRSNQLVKLNNKHNFSEDFLRLANMSIDFEYFDLRERYAYLLHLYYPNLAETIPTDFHAYREDIDFNNKDIENYYGYLRLVDNFLKNKSLEECAKINVADCYNPYSFSNIKNRLILVDSLTKSNALKNIYFSKLSAQGILSANNEEELASIISLLEQEDFPTEKLNNIKVLAAIQQVYFPGRTIPNVKLVDVDKKEIRLRELVTKPTVFYNWSVYFSGHHKKTKENIALLQKKYPNINFIGLNLDPGDTENWLNVLHGSGYPLQNQFQLAKVRIDQNLLRYFLDKLLFVNEEGTVVFGDAKLTSPDFENKLEQYLMLPKSGPLAATFQN